MLRKILIVGFGLWLHTSASALGLGEIQLESALNEPLVAEIPITVTSRDELRGFRARVALNDTFARYGLDRPVFLNTLTFFVRNDAAGQPVLSVRSNRPIAEPFVTFLLEATWDRGRLLREYTVLLDPPVFNDQAVAAPVSVPQSVAAQPSTRSGRVAQAPVAPAPRPTPRPVYRQPAITGQTYGPVQRNQNLWNISKSVELNGVSINQMMVAIYRANPEAFMGNINLLREGATLQIPDAASVSNLLRSEANSLVVAHNADWRSGRVTSGNRVASSSTPSAGERNQRLKLVAPDGSAADAGTDSGSAELDATRELLANEQAENENLSNELESVRSELEETKERLLNLQNSDLAELQGSLSQETPPVVDESAPEQPVVDVTDQSDSVVDETATTDTESVSTAATDPTTLLEPQDSKPTETTKPTMTIETEDPVEESSLISKIVSLATNWLVLAGVAVLSLIGLFFFMFRGREEEAAEPWDALEVDVDDSGLDLDASLDKVAQQTMAKDSLDVSRDVEYFEDTGTFKPIDFDGSSTGQVPAMGAPTDLPPFEDTLAGETGVKLDQADTLSEADFHMAYGLYDQAAELVGKASEKEPERIDLRMKLLEIFFVWGNKDEFRSNAAEVQGLLANMPGEWEKILIMGKQICPGDELFAGDATGDIMEDGVDLQLDTASTDLGGLDFQTEDFSGSDVFGEEPDDVVDLDLGDALFASDDAPTATGADSNVLDFSFDGADEGSPDDEPTASTEEVKEKIEQALSNTQGEDTEEMDLDQLGIDLDFGDITSVSEGTSGEFEVQDANTGTEASDENFDELFDGLGDVDDEPSMVIEAGMITDSETHDKLLDTSELKVEMEELLSADKSGLFDKDETSRGVESLLPDADMLADLPDEPEDETGSFSAEIRSLADDKLEIGEELAATTGGIDFGLGDDDETVLQEALIEPAAEPVEAPKTEIDTDTDTEIELDDVFSGSDDDTVLQSTLVADSSQVDLSEPFGDPSQDTTAMPAIEADDLDFGLGGDQSDSNAATFQGVFDSPEGTQEMPKLDEFSDDVFPGPDGRTQEMQAMDLDVGETVDDTGDNTTMRVATSNLALPENAELAINEVGTKLDLARAYLDMGDPEGARGILEEVMQEGNEGQQADARTLLDSLS